MNEDDEIISAESSSRISLTSAKTHVNCTEPYGFINERPMNNEASRLGLILVGELSETTCSHRVRKRIRRGIVWQAAYGPWLTHSESVARSPLSSNSFPIKPYTH